MYNVNEDALRTLHEAGRIGQIDPEVVKLLEAPARVVHFRIPLKRDDGSRQIFEAYRVRYNDALGPYRDGTRIAPDLDMDEVRALGLLMCIKHAAGRIPAGGGKGGIAADPRELSDNEYERLCRAYIRLLRPAGPEYDVPGADIGTSPRAMAWMLDEYEQITGHHCPAAISDKPVILGGARGGAEATGRGVFDALGHAAEERGMSVEGSRVVIQGFGQVGAEAASMLHEAGAKVIAVADIEGAVQNTEGLDVPALREHVDDSGTVKGFAKAQALDKDSVLEQPCDILVPAAVQGVIHEGNAANIRASLLVEAANAPTTFDADRILRDRGIFIVPDVIANSGSVHVCQMERTQGLYDKYWERDRINDLRRERVLAAWRDAVDCAREHDVSPRLGAWINALKLLEQAVHTRGWL